MSFDIRGNPSYLTPTFNAGNSQNEHIKDDKGEGDGKAKDQQYEQARKKSYQADKKEKQTVKEQRNVGGG